MQGGAELLRGRAVGGVADEDVLEAEGGLAGEARLGGADEVLAGEGLEARRAPTGARRDRESSTTAPRWKTSPSIAPRSSAARASGLEPVEAGAEKRVQARRQRERVEVALEGADAVLQLQHALLDEHRDELLGEQRVAGRGQSRAVRAPPRWRAAEQAVEQRVDLAVAERLEAHRHVPVGTVLEQLRPGEAEQHDRCVRDRRREAGEQVEQRRLGPVDVVDEHDQRPGTGRRGEEVADRPRRLLAPSCVPSASPSSCAIFAATTVPVRRRRRRAPRCSARASAGECSSSIPASSRTIWPTAQ